MTYSLRTIDHPVKSLALLLEETAALHPHLCPRQVLGVRMGILAGNLLDLDLPQTDKRLFTIVETDGCFSDGVAVATGCRVGRRTMRVEDYGKVAATFADTCSGRAIRISPGKQSRELAPEYASGTNNKWEAMLLGYQRIPDDMLFTVVPVKLTLSLDKIISRPGVRAVCRRCGEEIMNEREINANGVPLCKSCSGSSYYDPLCT